MIYHHKMACNILEQKGTERKKQPKAISEKASLMSCLDDDGRFFLPRNMYSLPFMIKKAMHWTRFVWEIMLPVITMSLCLVNGGRVLKSWKTKWLDLILNLIEYLFQSEGCSKNIWFPSAYIRKASSIQEASIQFSSFRITLERWLFSSQQLVLLFFPHYPISLLNKNSVTDHAPMLV